MNQIAGEAIFETMGGIQLKAGRCLYWSPIWGYAPDNNLLYWVSRRPRHCLSKIK